MYESQDRVETVQGHEAGNKGISIEEGRQFSSRRKCKEAVGRKERREHIREMADQEDAVKKEGEG